MLRFFYLGMFCSCQSYQTEYLRLHFLAKQTVPYNMMNQKAARECDPICASLCNDITIVSTTRTYSKMAMMFKTNVRKCNLTLNIILTVFRIQYQFPPLKKDAISTYMLNNGMARRRGRTEMMKKEKQFVHGAYLACILCYRVFRSMQATVRVFEYNRSIDFSTLGAASAYIFCRLILCYAIGHAFPVVCLIAIMLFRQFSKLNKNELTRKH